eukprot:CAMPEP_0203676762 /NCGR_PEP_ID=MMETSP0090-20130426/25681_1 /ASSEMBLY_ACC=CAM_ASM_001088 /TAXON_ID=426623 /ORGANISM="Chaetoceros affinis, Strain CCMP159" /LENGTH=341 /DNA_ID=CAMNT_0050543419 /DNA_START=17 /DNA_END=1042 /DNA_ORIENTATION=+
MQAASALTTMDKRGGFQRATSKHRAVINDDFPAEADRYHLHIALACPWACGVLAMLKLKGLDHVISYSIVHPTWGKTKPDDDSDKHHGWIFKNPGDEAFPNSLGHGLFECDDALIPDTVTNCKSVREVYELCGDFKGPFTTPVFYDKKTSTIINNESIEIMRMLNFDFNEFAKYPDINLYPVEEEKSLMELNDSLVYPKINNGVYKCGFAHSQEAYDQAVKELFEALEEVEVRLSKTRYLVGDKFTWLDLRLFMTMVRFDPVYTCYFKTNKKRLVDYPNLLGYVRDIYSMDEVKGVINMKHIKTHYYTSHPVHNTFGIIPVYDGPDLNEPHDREKITNSLS